MKTNNARGIAAAVLVLMLSGTPSAFAHHSFAAEFDVSRPIELVGTVKEMQFSNPHSWIYLDVMVNGEVQEWAIEGAAPNALLRRGWSRSSLPAGTVVHIRGFQARDRTFRAAGRDVMLEDGSKLFVGSSGIGAPDEENGKSDESNVSGQDAQSGQGGQSRAE